MLVLDGSEGEGGGQILRSALGLALVTGTPIRIENIRAGRPRPGLMRQHVAACHAAAAVGQCSVDEAEVGARTLTFRPRAVRGGHHRFTIETAGSATLVLQTVLPALLMAPAPSHLVLEGGTHNPSAPPFDFLARVFLPIINRLGPQVTAILERPGFYPAGGGRFSVSIQPAKTLQPVALDTRGPVRGRQVRAVVANLPRAIAERELSTLARRLSWRSEELQVEDRSDSLGPGNVV
ncbi:MAG TPA: RNA 3'-terminal phosphate cyclase, partial [Polyangia bacterium]